MPRFSWSTPGALPAAWPARACLAFALLLVTAIPAPSQTPRATPEAKTAEQPAKAADEPAGTRSGDPTAPRTLPQEFSDWLEEVDPLITGRERLAFLALAKDYQRHAFIRRFWQSRDPYPQTARNELKDRWDDRIELARSHFGGLRDDRARVFLLHGPPQNAFQARCTTTRSPAEVWIYTSSDQVDFSFFIIFIRDRNGLGAARVYRPTYGASSQRTLLRDAQDCLHGDRLAQAVAVADDPNSGYEMKLLQALAKPKPKNTEWVDTFAAYSTELPDGAETFQADLSLDFLGRYGNRTVVQGLVRVPHGEAAAGEFAGHSSYDFLLNGEIVNGSDLFESFRYRFGYPAGAFDGATLPLAFQRYLRPGSYRLVLRIEDLNSGQYFRTEEELVVEALDATWTPPREVDSETIALFEEATEALGEGETGVRIIPPRGDIQTGFVRIDTLVSGDVQKVRFRLDGREVLTRNRPPYNVEIDFGEFPRRHILRAEALGADGKEVAVHEVELNSARNRFDVRLVEPTRGKRYERSLRASAEVDVPDGRKVERVEFYVDDTLVATLFQPPWAQPIALPASQGEISYVRAVAYLPDGTSTEDVAFINAPRNLEEIDVQFVELYTSVFGGDGRPLRDLRRDEVTVVEDGVPQQIARFERVDDLAIHAGILIDTSGSMRNSLVEVRQAALSFLQQAITPKDRAAIITFSKFPRLAVKLTNDLRTLGGGLAGLAPEGETALYDSLIFGLYYFTGLRGQRAILLLSDGQDESSRFSFDQTLEYARRAGVTIYSIGLDIPAGDARVKLNQLAEETGGRTFFIHSVNDLEEIYAAIQEELRSQYLIAYQSTNSDTTGDFRSIELTVDRPKTKVNTISGYYP